MHIFFVFCGLIVTSLAWAKEGSKLKKVDYDNETSESKVSHGSEEATLSAEQAKKLQEDIHSIKAKQIESQKLLEEMENEEQ